MCKIAQAVCAHKLHIYASEHARARTFVIKFVRAVVLKQIVVGSATRLAR